MPTMSVDEAVSVLERWLYDFGPNHDWWNEKERAIKVILDRLKKLEDTRLGVEYDGS